MIIQVYTISVCYPTKCLMKESNDGWRRLLPHGHGILSCDKSHDLSNHSPLGRDWVNLEVLSTPHECCHRMFTMKVSARNDISPQKSRTTSGSITSAMDSEHVLDLGASSSASIKSPEQDPLKFLEHTMSHQSLNDTSSADVRASILRGGRRSYELRG